MHKPFVLPLAAGALLSMGCGASASPPPTPPAVEPVPDVIPPPRNPPAPNHNEPTALPPWDPPVVPSKEPMAPPQRTNPPIPKLVVEPDGSCHKIYEDARGGMDMWLMQSGFESVGNAYVNARCAPEGTVPTDALVNCGDRHQCPPEAAQVLETWRRRQKP